MKGILALLIFATVSRWLNAQFKVNAVIEFFRHGARSASFEPFDKSPETKLTRQYLTNVGLRTSFLLGKAQRKKYKDLWPKQYNAKEVRLLASKQERCLMTASAFGLGLFELGHGHALQNPDAAFYQPPVGPSPVPTSLPDEQALPEAFQPVNVSTFSDSLNESVFQDISKCPGMREHTAAVYRGMDAEFQDLFQPTYALLAKNALGAKRIFKDDKYSFLEALKVCDFLIADAYSNPASPTTPEELEHCYFVKSINNYARFRDDKLRGWVLGALGSFFVPHLQALADRRKAPKFFGVFTHQRDLGALIFLLQPGIVECFVQTYKERFTENKRGAEDPECLRIIKYSASLAFEVHETLAGTRSVAVFFNNRPLPVCANDEV